jgi:NADH dehydrogenase [ubiquinone] 1 alpha subcomplex assembly factor 5
MASAASVPRLFDRRTVRRNRDRAARREGDHGFLAREIALRLADRLSDVVRPFRRVLLFGARGADVLVDCLARRDGCESVVVADLSCAAVRAARDRPGTAMPALGVAADEEMIPFVGGCVDLLVGNTTLHWVNDLPGTLVQFRHALVPDGLFVGSMFGGRTLWELRDALLTAEAEMDGGASPRVSPFADVRDAGDLLSRAGFAMPVGDSEVVTVTYAEPVRLLADLQAMGESNALVERSRRFLRRDVLMRAMEHYRDRHATQDGRVPATFEIVTLTGWAPHPSQPKPLRPGSATTRLADALGATESAADAHVPRSGRSEGD